MGYQSEAELELQFIDQLNKQGYSTVSIPDYDTLLENFKVQFEAFNADKLDKPLTDKEWERILNLMLGKSVFQSAKILRDKFVLEREDGTKVYLSFFSNDHTKNIFQVTHQTTVVGKYVNRYDVTLLVNGLPLIQVELKRRGIDIREAVNQVMRYKKHSYNGLYHYIQIFIVSNGVDTKYFANSDREMLHSLAFFWTDFDNVRLTNLKDFSIVFLARDHIIKMLARYMILNDTDKLLMVMRPYQVYAVEALVRQATLTNRNAYVWHTTGAGKTLERYADDGVVHCRTKEEALYIKEKLAKRFEECKLELHPVKTRIVYCKDKDRTKEEELTEFDFLGYTFKAVYIKCKDGVMRNSFIASVSKTAAKGFRDKIKALEIHKRTGCKIDMIAELLNPMIRGWMNYFGKFNPSAMKNTLQCIERRLIKWAMCKYKSFRGRRQRAEKWLSSIRKREPKLFAHWSRMYSYC